ncbi:MAG: FecR family protein [Acidobacteriota bacterium]|nr:FecR family protein [Acidobacteriota bacterium]
MRASYSFLYRFVAIVLALTVSPLPALAQGSSSSQPAGQITALVPQATRNGSAAKTKDDVMWNDVIRTAGGGRARVQLRDGSILSLGSNSELKIVQHDPASQQTDLELNYGRVRSRVVQITKPGGRFQVKTPTAVAGVVGTDYIVIYENGHMQVIVFSGQVVIIGVNGAVMATVGPGQMVDIVNGQVTGPTQTPPSVQQDAIDQTNPGSGVVSGGGGGEGHLLRNILIILGVAAVGAIIYSTTGSPGPAPTTTTPSPTFCTNCDGVRRR